MSNIISGASHVSQVNENLRAAELKSRLIPAALGRIEAILGNDPDSLG